MKMLYKNDNTMNHTTN